MESNQKLHQEEEKKQSRKRYDHLREIEHKVQEYNRANKVGEGKPVEGYEKMPFEEKNKGKFFTTFPYPYMNGFLHLGHAFSMSKNEFMARYQRQIGKNVLFPFSFHCTGMPIQAAANKLKREITSGKIKRQCQCQHQQPNRCPCPKDKSKDKGKDQKKDECVCPPPTQYEILQQLGIPESEIPKFQDSLHWLMYFPPEAKKDLMDFGLMADWRRSFITTPVNPFYDSFIRWQFNQLKSQGKVKFGKRYTIYSETDKQPCADHDRSKGEGVGPQEYTIIKLKLKEMPPSIKDFAGKDVYMVAATLRPETMYGQTNCFVLPTGEYGLFEMINNEYFICSERAARNMAYQDMTKEPGQYPSLAKISGQELIGIPLKAPLTTYETVYALPMETISMVKGTGIVTSVPSDAPDDFATLRDLKEKKGLREKYNVKEEWVMPFDPIPIIEIPGFGNLAAVKLVEDMKIKSHKDKELLNQAKDKVYQKGFYEGVMIVGLGNQMKVQEAKPLVRKYMIDNNLAQIYQEPENEVVDRNGNQCIVALCDQWFLTYGEEEWKKFCMEHVKSDQFNAYGTKTRQEFIETLDWLGGWACSRTAGLGTILPWDTQFVIESLSDSTIYMAYYTIAHMLQGGVLDGSKEGPLGIKPEQMTPEVWDYIYKKGAYPQGCTIPEESLKKMRYEFEYWYPMDLRCSGKDLIRNHLTMSLYNHAAIWEDKNMMPRGFFCNGYIMLNGKKMSKSEGNFLTVRDCIEKYGVDATRVALADSGDSLDDANFDEQVANAAILRLFVFEKWIQEEIKKQIPDSNVDFATHSNYDTWDKIFENEINNAIEIATKDYNEMKFKQVLKHGFYELQNIKEDYLIAKEGKMNPALLLKFIETQLILINPICPHFAQYCWSTHVLPVLQKSQNYGKAAQSQLMDQGWPEPTRQFDKLQRQMLEYMRNFKSTIRMAYDKAKSGGKKAKKGGKQEEKAPIENCIVFVAFEYPDWQKQTIEILQQFQFDQENKIQGNYIEKIKAGIQGPKSGNAIKFAAHVAKEAEVVGKETALALQTPFNEVEILDQNRSYVFENMPTLKNIKVLSVTEEVDIEAAKQAKEQAVPGKPSSLFF